MKLLILLLIVITFSSCSIKITPLKSTRISPTIIDKIIGDVICYRQGGVLLLSDYKPDMKVSCTDGTSVEIPYRP